MCGSRLEVIADGVQCSDHASTSGAAPRPGERSPEHAAAYHHDEGATKVLTIDQDDNIV